MLGIKRIHHGLVVCCGITLILSMPLDALAQGWSLHAFTGGSDGANPQAGLLKVPASNGGFNYFGTTMSGGISDVGTVFKIDPDGNESILHAFAGGDDGSFPVAGLIKDSLGNLYGTTMDGGGSGCLSNLGCGTVFRLAPDGTETVLYTFFGGSDGANPNCYSNGCGTVFKIAPDGTETVLVAFDNDNGRFPEAGLISDHAGNLYGTAS